MNTKNIALDSYHARVRNKEFNRFIRINYERFFANIPANKHSKVREVLKQAYYAGFNQMFRMTDD